MRCSLVLHKKTHIASTKLIWTAVILNIAARLVDQFQNGRLKMYSEALHIKSFGGRKGVYVITV